MTKTMINIIDEESKRFAYTMVYYSIPYTCCYEEMKSYIDRICGNRLVDENKILIIRDEKETKIYLRPKKETSKLRKSSLLQKIWIP